MTLLELVISAGMLVAAVVFVAWVAYTCGYDHGWADRQDGKPHRDDRRDRVTAGKETASDE